VSKSFLFGLELGASFFTLAGIYLGSTTADGAVCYLVSLAFWFWLTWAKELWGLMPLNVASLVVTFINLWRAA